MVHILFPLALLWRVLVAADSPPATPSLSEIQVQLKEMRQEFQRFREQVEQRRQQLPQLPPPPGTASATATATASAHPRRGSGRGAQSVAEAGMHHARRVTAATVDTSDVQGALSHLWLLMCGALVMFMQAGFALLEAGACRMKNVSNILMKNVTDVCLGTLCWWAFGWMFAYGPIEGETKFAGNTMYFGHDFMQEPAVGTIVPSNACRDWFFQWAFCSAAATIVSGGIAERVNFPSYLIYTAWMSTFIYPVVVAWTWSGTGWLQEGKINDVGYMDFAGSGIVHMCGGVGALTAAVIVGPRTGRFDPKLASEFEPHSIPLVVLGTFILWFGWYGFNCGSTLGMADTATGQLAASVAMNTTISAATGGLVILAVRFGMHRKYDLGGMCNGVLAGLVSITAPCGNVESGSALVIGALGALVYQGASMLLQKLKVDDPLDAFPVHGAAGAWGTLAAAIFDWGDGIGVFHGWKGFSCVRDPNNAAACMDGARGKAFAANLVGIICIALWCALLSAVVLVPLKLTGRLRADDQVQAHGLDVAKHSPTKAYDYSQAGAGESWAQPRNGNGKQRAELLDPVVCTVGSP